MGKLEANIYSKGSAYGFTVYTDTKDETGITVVEGAQPYRGSKALTRFKVLSMLVNYGVTAVYDLDRVGADGTTGPLNPCNIADENYRSLRKQWCKDDNIDFNTYYNLLDTYDEKMEVLYDKHRCAVKSELKEDWVGEYE